MATTSMNSTATPGEVKKGEDVPSNLDAARPVIDRIKDIDLARDEAGSPLSGGDTVIDNTPETAMAEEQARKDEAAAEKDAEKPTKKAAAKEAK